MSPVVLRMKEAPKNIPLEAEVISPDLFVQHSQAEIAAMPVALGNETYRLGDFFEVEGERSDEIVVEGCAGRVKWIGSGMTRGRVIVHGDVGMHAGSYMRGGEIRVEGNADDFLGVEMEGGLIRVKGNARHRVGAAYRGSKYGMQGGTILVDGNVGHEVGAYMRRGLIVIKGNAEDFLGAMMMTGTICLFGQAGIRTGGGMQKGTIVCMRPIDLLPTFAYDCTYAPVFLQILFKELKQLGVECPAQANGLVRRYHGDLADVGKGEILIAA
ncbi:formylmethanofuran dehydrogenase subunit C [Candidatus Methylomirabilis sp.]|uniref:formylmethanofuran dehydrogenase subunit C n=1 Tax=Candidatus Methylomirabilis sp. TaxID=2032687 RepID=UPI002A5D5590|nr:formylmethanofuran dehydrogenase subunit C [Candidatus Methylomirabilis sp.]